MNTFSSWRVTSPIWPPWKSVCIKSSIVRMFLFKYQFRPRSEEHTSELQSLTNLVCLLLLEKKNNSNYSWDQSAGEMQCPRHMRERMRRLVQLEICEAVKYIGRWLKRIRFATLALTFYEAGL